MIQWLILLSNKYLLAEITNPQHSSLTASFHLLLTTRSESGQPQSSVQSGGRDVCFFQSGLQIPWGDPFIVSAAARYRYSTNSTLWVLQGRSLNPACCKFCRESCCRVGVGFAVFSKYFHAFFMFSILPVCSRKACEWFMGKSSLTALAQWPPCSAKV